MTTYRARTRHSRLLIGALIVVALVFAGFIGALVARSGQGAAPDRSATRPPANGATATTASATPGSITVNSVTPADGAVAVAPTTPITVTLTSALAKGSPLPSLTPVPTGTWHANGAVLTFTPTVPYTPLTEMTLSIPGGASGVESAGGARLDQSVVEHFRVANGSVLRLQQLLSLLAYSPLAWTPSGATIAPTDTAAQIAALYVSPAGAFSWINHGWPARLQVMWQPGVNNIFTQGLLMSFEADHGLTANGRLGPGVWSTLLAALAGNTVNTGGYNYTFADKAPPEMLTIYHDGKVVLRSPANTGIASSPTPDGTFPVNTRLRRQVMRGTNPNGQKYADLVQYIAYFHGNDAVHYMDRSDYGIPQSLGCIELPLADAARAWPYLAYGTLVTVVH